jgi:hypothetical protein
VIDSEGAATGEAEHCIADQDGAEVEGALHPVGADPIRLGVVPQGVLEHEDVAGVSPAAPTSTWTNRTTLATTANVSSPPA